MKNFTQERQELLKELKELGVKAPSAMYPSNTHDDNKEGMLDRMKSHVTELVQIKYYANQKKANADA